MEEQTSLFETRYPYASEAKDIIAEALSDILEPIAIEQFRTHWEVKMKPGGGYAITRDTFIDKGVVADTWVHKALSDKYSAEFIRKGDKTSADISLPKIEAPSGVGLKGAHGKPCCHGRACPACPLNRA